MAHICPTPQPEPMSPNLPPAMPTAHAAGSGTTLHQQREDKCGKLWMVDPPAHPEALSTTPSSASQTLLRGSNRMPWSCSPAAERCPMSRLNLWPWLVARMGWGDSVIFSLSFLRAVCMRWPMPAPSFLSAQHVRRLRVAGARYAWTMSMSQLGVHVLRAMQVLKAWHRPVSNLALEVSSNSAMRAITSKPTRSLARGVALCCCIVFTRPFRASIRYVPSVVRQACPQKSPCG